VLLLSGTECTQRHGFQQNLVHPNHLPLLIAHQRVLVVRAILWMREEMFPSVEVSTKDHTKNRPTDFFSDYVSQPRRHDARKRKLLR
jgi:hypothetical protein